MLGAEDCMNSVPFMARQCNDLSRKPTLTKRRSCSNMPHHRHMQHAFMHGFKQAEMDHSACAVAPQTLSEKRLQYLVCVACEEKGPLLLLRPPFPYSAPGDAENPAEPYQCSDTIRIRGNANSIAFPQNGSRGPVPRTV